MGYRSDVRSIIYGTPDRVLAFWTKHKLSGNLMLKDHPDEISRYHVQTGTHAENIVGIIDLEVQSWKWYEGYEHVDAWTQMYLDAQPFGLEYEFIRVGEEEGDIERHSSEDAQGYLYTRTEIIADLPAISKESTNEED